MEQRAVPCCGADCQAFLSAPPGQDRPSAPSSGGSPAGTGAVAVTAAAKDGAAHDLEQLEHDALARAAGCGLKLACTTDCWLPSVLVASLALGCGTTGLLAEAPAAAAAAAAAPAASAGALATIAAVMHMGQTIVAEGRGCSSQGRRAIVNRRMQQLIAKPQATAARPQACTKATAHAPAKAVLRLRQAALAAGASLLVAAPALAGDLALGEEVFSNNCAACHTGGQNVVQVEKTLQKAALEQYLDGGFSEASIITQVENGKNAMPAWAGRLSEDEITAVAAYVYNQANNDLW